MPWKSQGKKLSHAFRIKQCIIIIIIILILNSTALFDRLCVDDTTFWYYTTPAKYQSDSVNANRIGIQNAMHKSYMNLAWSKGTTHITNI